MNRSPWGVIGCAVVLAGLALASWRWETHVPRQVAPSSTNAGESLQLALKQFPLPVPPPPSDDVPASAWDGVVKANPFTPERWHAPEPDAQDDAAPRAPAPPPQPAFVYKGRIVMGAAQRAILEETGTKKTYFLQVGQDVTGFRVLDISETQVVLSETSTQHEVVVSLTTKPQGAP